MNQTVFALVDCNNFFVSCERVFRPDLEGKPVVVLSSNDGCVVARSNEAKSLDVPMGAPVFKYKEIFNKHKIVKFSANFDLYGDISKRIIHILTELTPRTEIYSIDEAFLELSKLASADYLKIAQKLRDRVWQEVGIPVSIGIASSKTLAKLASDYAKKHDDQFGITDLVNTSKAKDILNTTPIESVWGVGRRLAPRLRAEGVSTADDLASMSTKRARQIMGIRGEQMVRELNGQTCFEFTGLDTLPKSISRTRTFGEDTNQFHVIEAAIASFATQAAFRLRKSNQLTRKVGLFMMSNRHKPGYESWTAGYVFESPTADTGELIKVLVGLARKIFMSNQSYHRAGVWFEDFVSDRTLQVDLLGRVDVYRHLRSQKRMASFDSINKRFGKGTIYYATEDLAETWLPKYQIRSPRYTTSWNELPVVR